MRQPSISPPSFYDDVPPPPLLTPPPNYDDLSPRFEVRHDYFDVDGSGSNSDEISDPEPEVHEAMSHPVEHHSDTEEEPEEENIVDMVGLEDLSLGLRTTSFVERPFVEVHSSRNWGL